MFRNVSAGAGDPLSIRSNRIRGVISFLLGVPMQFKSDQIVKVADGTQFRILWVCTNKDGTQTHLAVKSISGKRIKKKIAISEVVT